MKTKQLFLLLFLFCSLVQAQKRLPKISVKSFNENNLDLNLQSMEQVLIISFWATWCEPCIKELNAFNKNLSYLEEELNSKLIAISTDDSRTVSRIIPMVSGNSWDFEVYLDTNQKIKRALNIIDIPHTLVVFQNKIVYEHTGYLNGDEDELFKKIVEINNNEF
ncbi:TlpA family protein disulfide reductase [Lutimonas vermicola]|uniref:TlpA family protein disulfide reductase n=1 Tax=Lutimonas vermicola TaxID=414288 RepID=A0ABU9L502_9FLAO